MQRQFLMITLPIICLFGSESKVGTYVLASGGLGTIEAGIGAALDASDRKALNQESSRTIWKIDRGEPLSTSDVKKMTKAGLSDEVIISQIDAIKSPFHLSSADVIDLKKAGVSQRVINHMIQN